jgi:transposase-like protein
MARASGGTRRRLTQDQQREIAQLYGKTGTPTAEIRERFGIGESTLYRVLQKHGVSLRGRTTSPVDAAATAAVKTAVGARSRARSRRGLSVGPQGRRGSKTAITQDGAVRQFRVRFEGHRVFAARDVRDAVRQAEALGATDIVEVTRLA